MELFLSIAIVGVFASILIEATNKIFGLGSTGAKSATILVSIILGGFYTLFQDTTWWTTMLGVLGSASTVYAFFFKGK